MAEMCEGQTNVEPLPPERLDLTPCGICGRTFAPQALDKHERVCEKQASKRRKPFDSLAQRVAGTDLAPFHMKSYLKPKQQQQAVSTVNEKVPVTKLVKQQQYVEEMVIQPKIEEPKPVIQSTSMTITHEPTPKRSSTSSVRSGGIATPAGERCPHCDRSFNSRAYDRHVEWCKEHQARAQAQPSPAAVQMAKERLEARTKYRAPLLAKTVQKAVNREKYSPSNNKTGEFQRSPSIRRDSSADSKASSVMKSNFQRTPSVRRNNSFDEERKSNERKVRRSPSLRRDSSFEEDHNRGAQRTPSLRRDSSFEERNNFKRIPSIRNNNSQDRRNVRKESPASRHKDESYDQSARSREYEGDNEIIDGRKSNKTLSSISSPMLSAQSLPCNTPQSTNIPILKRKKSKIGMKLPQSQINDIDVNQLAFGMNVIHCSKPKLITWKDTVRGNANSEELKTASAKINYTTQKNESKSISLDRNVTYIKDDELDRYTENNEHEDLTCTKYDNEHFDENDFQKHTPDELLFGNIGDFRNISKETITISSCHRFRTGSEILSESDFSLNALENTNSKQSCDNFPDCEEHLQSETLNSAREKKRIAYHEQKCGNSSFVCENSQMNVTRTLIGTDDKSGEERRIDSSQFNYECSQKNLSKKSVYRSSDEYDRSCGDGLVNDCYRNSEEKTKSLNVNDQSECTEQMNITRTLKGATDKFYDAQTPDNSQYLQASNNSFNKSNSLFEDNSVNNSNNNLEGNEANIFKGINNRSSSYEQPQINVNTSNKFNSTHDTQSCNSDLNSQMICEAPNFDNSHHGTKKSPTKMVNRVNTKSITTFDDCGRSVPAFFKEKSKINAPKTCEETNLLPENVIRRDAGDRRKKKNVESRSNTSSDSRSDVLVFGDIKSNYFKTSQQLFENEQLDSILDECDYFIENFAQSSTGNDEMEKSVEGTGNTVDSLCTTNNCSQFITSDSSKKCENDRNLNRSNDDSTGKVFVPLNSPNSNKNGEIYCQPEINKKIEKSEKNFEPSQGMSSTNFEDTEGSFDPCVISGIMPLEKDQFDTSERKSLLFDSFCITKHSFQFNDFFPSDVKRSVKTHKSPKTKKISFEICQTPEKYTSTPVKDSDSLKRISSEGIIINESCIIPEKRRKISFSDLNDSVLIIDSSPISENFERFAFDIKNSFEIYEDASNENIATTSFRQNLQNSKCNENFVFGDNSSDNSLEDTSDSFQNWKTSERLEYKTTLSTVYESDLDKKEKNSSDDERKTPSPTISVNDSNNGNNSEMLTNLSLDFTNVTNESKANDTVESGNVSNAETDSPKRSWQIPENVPVLQNECAEQLFTIYEHMNINHNNIKSDVSSSDLEPDVKANCKRCNSCTNIGEKSMLYNKVELENSYQAAEKGRIEKLGRYAYESNNDGEFIDSDGYIFTTGALLLEESFNDIQNGVQITEIENECVINETNEGSENQSFSVEVYGNEHSIDQDENPTQCDIINEEQTNHTSSGIEDEINKTDAAHYKNDSAAIDENILLKTCQNNEIEMNIPSELKSDVTSKGKKVKKTKNSHTKLKASFSKELTKSTVILPTLGKNKQSAMLKKMECDMTNSVVEKLKKGLKKDKLPPLKRSLYTREYDPFVSAERQLKELLSSDTQRPLTTATKEYVQQSHRPNTAPTNQLPVVNPITKHASGPNLSLPVITTKVAFAETSKNNKNNNNQKINSKSIKKIISKKPNNQLCDVNVGFDRCVPNKNVINFDEIPIRTKNTQNVAMTKLSDLNRSIVSNTNDIKGTFSNNLDLRNTSNSEFTKNENSKNSNRSSIIEPPTQFEDRLKSLQSNFELIENIINDNYVSVTSKDALISNGEKNQNHDKSANQVFDDSKSEFDVSVIDPALINSVDNLSIPAELKSDNDVDHYSIQYDKQISTLEPFVLTKTEMNFKRTTYDSDSVGDDFDFEGFMSSFEDDEAFPSMKTLLQCNAIPENKALPTSASLNSSVLNQPTEKSSENMKSTSQFLKRSISLLDPVAKPKTMKNKSDVEKYFGDKVDKQKTSEEEKISAEELFGVGDELYEEYKKYEELFLQEKKIAESRDFHEESVSSNMVGPGGEQSSPEEMSSPEKYHSVKPSGDSAYSSLNRATPKPLPRSQQQQQQQQQRLRNRPSVESDRCPSSSGSDVSLPPVSLKLKDMDSRPTASERRKSRSKHVPDRMQMLHLTEDTNAETSNSRKSSFDSTSSQRMSKFCHECGSKFPVSAAKFCVECGVKRLVL